MAAPVTLDTPEAVDAITEMLDAHETPEITPDPSRIVVAVMTQAPCVSCDSVERYFKKLAIRDLYQVDVVAYEPLPRELQQRMVTAAGGMMAPVVLTPQTIFAGLHPGKLKDLVTFAAERDAELAMAS